MADNPPIVQADPDGAGKAPILSYNVPDSTSYSGRNVLRMVFDGDLDPFRQGPPVPIPEADDSLRAMRQPTDDGFDPSNDPPFGDQLVTATVGLLSPAAGGSVTAKGGTVQLTAVVKVTVSPSRVKPLEVLVHFGGVTVVAARQTDGTYAATWSAPGGTVTITATAEVDGQFFSSTPRDFTVTMQPDPVEPARDVAIPTVQITGPADGAALDLDPATGATRVTVQGRAADNAGGVGVTIAVDGGATIAAVVAADGSFTEVLSVPGSGLHEIAVVATDQAGNTNRAAVRVNLLQQTALPRYTLVIAEYLQLSNFLGSYGAGRTVQTFSLLPGERTRISIKTFRSSTSTSSTTSSFLDSFSGTTSQALEDTISSEQTTKTNEDQSFKAAASVEAAGNWGFASAKVSASAAYGSSSARESLGKSVMSAVGRHASEVSSKRDVKIDTAGVNTTTDSTEQSVERTLENINVGRTLNFVFRQMNQEFISILHLADIRIGLVTQFADATGNLIFRGTAPLATYREVTLPQLDGLLAEVVRPELTHFVRNALLTQLDGVVDWRGNRREVLERATFVRPARDETGEVIDGKTVTDGPYLRFRPLPATDEAGGPEAGIDRYEDETGNQFDVPGVILQARKSTLRTDGLMVDALLGGGNALDPYSTQLQTSAIEAKVTANELAAEEVVRQQLGRALVDALSGDEAVQAYQKIFRPAPITVAATNGESH